jgi:hypothetical protein
MNKKLIADHGQREQVYPTTVGRGWTGVIRSCLKTIRAFTRPIVKTAAVEDSEFARALDSRVWKAPLLYGHGSTRSSIATRNSSTHIWRCANEF